MLTFAAVTPPKNPCDTERVPCRRRALEVGREGESGAEAGFAFPSRHLVFPRTLCSEVAPGTAKAQAPLREQPSEK